MGFVVMCRAVGVIAALDLSNEYIPGVEAVVFPFSCTLACMFEKVAGMGQKCCE